MLGLELFIIYLAIGAPFGVNRGWHERAAFSLGAAIRAALLWPVTVAQGLARWRRQKKAAGEGVKHFGPEHQAQRDALVALTKLSRALYPIVSAATAGQLWIQCRDALDKYTGLTSNVYNLDEDADLGPRALELFRLEGLTGQDLQRSARCVQRRNAARLRAHQIQARQDLSEALGQAQQTVNNALHRQQTDKQAADIYVKELWQGFIEQARQLCLTLGDTETAQEVTRRLAEAHAQQSAPPAIPAFESIQPPQSEVEKCLPETNLPFPRIPAGIASSLR